MPIRANTGSANKPFRTIQGVKKANQHAFFLIGSIGNPSLACS
jgi:hypothetical protein